MQTLLLTIYILMWPVISIGILGVIWIAVVREVRQKRKNIV